MDAYQDFGFVLPVGVPSLAPPLFAPVCVGLAVAVSVVFVVGDA
jgi:hypothetical protein